MDFKLTDEQQLLLENLKELLEREAPESYLRECDSTHTYPDKLAKALVDNGFTLLGVPEEHGGIPSDVLTQALVMEEIGKAGGPGYLFTHAIMLQDVLAFGSDEQISKAMEFVETGHWPYSLAITEPQAGSDDSAIMTTATRRNGKVYINGQKTFISSADETKYMLVVTRDVDDPKPHDAMSMWLIRADSPGISTQKLDKLGTVMGSLNEVYFDDVECEESDLVGVEGCGFYQVMKTFETERIVLCALSLGWAEAAFEDAARYANDRVQFGQPIGRFQLIQEKIAVMKMKIELMRNMVYRVAWEKDNDVSVRISSSLCKLYCAQAAHEVIDDAMQILGGLGYTNESRIPRLWRDSRQNRIGGGTDEIMIYIAGKQLLKQYR